MALNAKQIRLLMELDTAKVKYINVAEGGEVLTLHFDNGHNLELTDIGEQGWSIADIA